MRVNNTKLEPYSGQQDFFGVNPFIFFNIRLSRERRSKLNFSAKQYVSHTIFAAVRQFDDTFQTLVH
jgi:hypothetical protein